MLENKRDTNVIDEYDILSGVSAWLGMCDYPRKFVTVVRACDSPQLFVKVI